jgi:hypothetical protein
VSGPHIPTTPGIYIEKDESWLDHAWTSVPNALIRNSQVSWDAKGAFAWLASHQEMTFRITAQQIADAGTRGRNHAYAMVRELEEWGWVTRRRIQNPETGYNDIQVYKLHPAAVPAEQRTHKPSKAQPRPKSIVFQGAQEQGVPGRPVADPDSKLTTSADPAAEQGVTARVGTERSVSTRALRGRRRARRQPADGRQLRRPPMTPPVPSSP